MARLIALVAALGMLAGASGRTVVVSGATGRSGSLIYSLLKNQGVDVRGLVRNTTKAREYLNCSACDASEGIFVGDITKPETLGAVMAGADSLVIATGKVPEKDTKLTKTILYEGVANQVAAFLNSPGPKPQDRHVSLISMQFTTLADTLKNKFIARFWGGFDVGFYSLQGEQNLMSANVPFTIVKACGLTDEPPNQSEIIVGHDDKSWTVWEHHTVSRADVARVLAVATTNPAMSKNIRMDFCSKKGTPQADAMEILKAAMQPWDTRKTQSASAMV